MNRIFAFLAVAALLLAGTCYAADSGGVSTGTQRWDGNKIQSIYKTTSTTATGDITLSLESTRFQRVDPNGANRDVTLPAEETNDGLWYLFVNSGGANNVVVKNDAGSTIVTLTTGQASFVSNSGSAWTGTAFSASASGFLAADGSVAGATGSAQDFGSNGVKADVVAESTGAAGVTIDGVVVKDTTVDVNGTADAIILDADADTTFSAPTANQIDVEIAGADDFTFTANDFTALSGSALSTDTINETTGAAGVTIDSLVVKDGGATVGASGTIDLNGVADSLVLDANANTTISSPTDDQIDVEIAGADDFTFTANTLTALSGSSILTNTISETTAANGVAIDGVTIKDGDVLLGDSALDHTITILSSTDEAAGRTLTIPALGANATFSFTDLAQSVSAINTFNYGMFKLGDVSDDHKVLLQPSEEAADRTLTIPVLGGNDTLATVGLAQSFTAIKTFDYGMFKLGDVSDNHQVLLQPSEELGNRTLTIPVLGGNDTLVTLGLDQTFSGAITFDSAAAKVVRASQRYRYTGGWKVGGTAGFVIAAADNIFNATCPASTTGAKLIVPIQGLKVGSIITAFGVLGQIESAGNTVTLDGDLRVSTTAAGDFTDASVSTMTQVSAIADQAIDSGEDKTGLSQTVAQGEMYYIVITVTTNASTDVDIRGVTLVVTEQ